MGMERSPGQGPDTAAPGPIQVAVLLAASGPHAGCWWTDSHGAVFQAGPGCGSSCAHPGGFNRRQPLHRAGSGDSSASATCLQFVEACDWQRGWLCELWSAPSATCGTNWVSQTMSSSQLRRYCRTTSTHTVAATGPHYCSNVALI